MLEFKKSSDYSTTTFAVTETVMVCVRFTNNKGYRLVINLDGTIGMLGKRVDDVLEMSNDDFMLYSDIQFNEVN